MLSYFIFVEIIFTMLDVSYHMYSLLETLLDNHLLSNLTENKPLFSLHPTNLHLIYLKLLL